MKAFRCALLERGAPGWMGFGVELLLLQDWEFIGDEQLVEKSVILYVFRPHLLLVLLQNITFGTFKSGVYIVQ